MTGRLAGKVAIVTGGAQGIGRAACLRFAGEGAAVALYDRDPAGAVVAHEIEGAGGTALFTAVDLTIEADVAAAVAGTELYFGAIHVLYNNAGGSSAKDGPLTTCPDEEFWHAIQRELYTTWLCSRHAIPAIARAGGGSVINTTSGIASRGGRGHHAYAAAKGAVLSLTRSMAVEFAPQRIRVNAISPGGVATPRILAKIRESEAARALIEDNALLGIVYPEEIAALAVYLAGDESRVTTGQIMAVDSGYLA